MTHDRENIYELCERLHIPYAVPQMIHDFGSVYAPHMLLGYINFMDKHNLFSTDVFENLITLRNERLKVIKFCEEVFAEFMNTDIALSSVNDNIISQYTEFDDMKFQPESVLPWSIFQQSYRLYPVQLMGKQMYCLLSHKASVKHQLTTSAPSCGVHLTLCDVDGNMLMRHFMFLPVRPYKDTYDKWNYLCLDEIKLLLSVSTRSYVHDHALDFDHVVAMRNQYIPGIGRKFDVVVPEEFCTSDEACADVLRSSYRDSFFNAVLGHGMRFDNEDYIYGTADNKVLKSTAYMEYRNEQV